MVLTYPSVGRSQCTVNRVPPYATFRAAMTHFVVQESYFGAEGSIDTSRRLVGSEEKPWTSYVGEPRYKSLSQSISTQPAFVKNSPLNAGFDMRANTALYIMGC